MSKVLFTELCKFLSLVPTQRPFSPRIMASCVKYLQEFIQQELIEELILVGRLYPENRVNVG